MRHTQGDNIVKRYAITKQLQGTDIATVRRSHRTVHLLLLCAPQSRLDIRTELRRLEMREVQSRPEHATKVRHGVELHWDIAVDGSDVDRGTKRPQASRPSKKRQLTW